MKHKGGQMMKLPDGKKSLFHYCPVWGVLAGVGFTPGLFLRLCVTVVNNSYES